MYAVISEAYRTKSLEIGEGVGVIGEGVGVGVGAGAGVGAGVGVGVGVGVGDEIKDARQTPSTSYSRSNILSSNVCIYYLLHLSKV